MTRGRIRTLAEAIDLRDFRRITAGDLLAGGLDFCQQVRRQATLARASGQPIVCAECGWPVYLQKNGITKEYLWAHFAEAPNNCVWFTGHGRSPDQVSAVQFNGAQESPLHHRLKHLIAELLGRDPQTDGEIVVDAYLAGTSGSRRPDVRLSYGGRPLAIEIQLANTQLPIILGRERFYSDEGRHLLWVVWKPNASRKADLPQALLDIVTSHNDNLFSLDDETIALSHRTRTFCLRAHWWEGGAARDRVLSLTDLTYPLNRLPFAVDKPPLWHQTFKQRWAAAGKTGRIGWRELKYLYAELIVELGLRVTDTQLNCDYEADRMISLLLSLERGEIIGSRQNNVTEALHTFLATKSRMRLARIVEHSVVQSGRRSLLEREKTRELLERAKATPQAGSGSIEAAIARALFPDWSGLRS